MRRFLLAIYLTIGSLSQLSAQNGHKPETQYWAFMVRNTARLQEIAYRFQVTEADIKKNSDLKGKTVYPGKVIVVPVKVRPATWDPSKFNPNKPFLSGEDARPQLDFEWNNDALDPLLKDDYILISEIQGDSIQTEKMNKHIGKIDKQLAQLNHQIDSIKNTEFAFQYDEKDMNAVLKRMEKARQRYYAQSPLGKEVDSLNDVKTKLNEEINRLRNKLSEYDYLNENAYYFEKNREGESDMLERINNRPGEQLIAESNYIKKIDNDSKKEKRKNRLKKKKKKSKKNEVTPIETEQLLVRDIAPVDTVSMLKIKPTVATDNTPTDNKEQPTTTKEETKTTAAVVEKETKTQSTEQSKPTEQRANETAKDDKLLTTKITLNPSNTASTNTSHQNKPIPPATPETKQPDHTVPTEKLEVINVPPTQPKEAPKEERVPEVPKETVAVESQPKTTPTQTKQEEQTKINTPVIEKEQPVEPTTETQVVQPETIPVKEEPKVESIKEQNKPQDIAPVEKQEVAPPVVEEVKKELPTNAEVTPTNPTEAKVEDIAPRPKPTEEVPQRNTTSSVQMPQQNGIKPLSERDLSMKDEIKKAIANKVVPKDVDPLDEFSDSPDFAFRGLNFQSINIGKTKNVPKYLIPVDPITSLKAKIWVEKFKEDMKTRDFKKAEINLRKAVETNPNSAETWTYHAEMLSAAGNAQEAQKEYMIATAVDASFARPYYKLALLYENSNNVDKAYEFYALAVEADSSFYKAYLNRANLSFRLGDIKGAIDDYNGLLSINKNFSLAYKERGALRMMDRDYAGAVEDFNAYLDIEDPSGEVLYKRGVAKVYTGKIIEGCNDFNLSLQLNYTDAAKAIKKYCE